MNTTGMAPQHAAEGPSPLQAPNTYAWDLESVIEAYREYLGVSKSAMARRLGMDRRSYQRIATGQEACPPGLLDALNRIVAELRL